jgi:hypothetical protein
MDQNQMGQTCSCSHHKVMPILVVLLGLSFLLTALHVYSAGVNSIIWPIILILAGLQKMFSRKCSCCKKM